MPNALPLLLLGGAAVMMMGGKKRKAAEAPEEEVPTAEFVPMMGQSMADKCRGFIDAAWVEPGPGELPIKSVVIEESVLPEMREAARAKRLQKGSDLSTDFSNALVLVGLNMIAPNCNWTLTSLGWRYADNQPFEGRVLKVHDGLKKLAIQVIEDANSEPGGEFSLAPEDVPDDEKEEPKFGLSEG